MIKKTNNSQFIDWMKSFTTHPSYVTELVKTEHGIQTVRVKFSDSSAYRKAQSTPPNLTASSMIESGLAQDRVTLSTQSKELREYAVANALHYLSMRDDSFEEIINYQPPTPITSNAQVIPPSASASNNE